MTTTHPGRYQINTTSFDYFWKRGAGVPLLQKLGYTPDINNAYQYKNYLFDYDKIGDKIAAQLHCKIGVAKARETLNNYIQGKPVSPEHAQLLDYLFETTPARPAWLDPGKMNKGMELCRRSGIPGLLVLRNYCLMGGYESAAINKPLIYTGALKQGAAKRIAETTVFWISITRQDAFDEGGNGLYHVISTRLIHSLARINILQHTDWDSSQWGLPLNTWDMLATQLGFSLVFLTGLRLMGFTPTAEEVDGLFHFWKYIGYLLGIPLSLLPDDELQAIESLYYWTMTQSKGDADSIALAQALVAETMGSDFPPSPVLRKLMRELHLFYHHYLLGAYSCSLLQIPRPGMAGRLGNLILWRLRQKEKRIHRPGQREQAVEKGGNRQSRALANYLEYKNKRQ